MLEKVEGRRRRGHQKMRRLDGISGLEFELVLGVSDGQGSLDCFSPWSHKDSDWTE